MHHTERNTGWWEMKAIEIGIILIIILVIFGAILSSIENSTEKAMKEVEANNMEKLTSEVIANLINNPGVPENSMGKAR